MSYLIYKCIHIVSTFMHAFVPTGSDVSHVCLNGPASKARLGLKFQRRVCALTAQSIREFMYCWEGENVHNTMRRHYVG